MRTFTLLLPVLLLFVGCYDATPRRSDPNLLDPTIPAKPHDGPVEVYFPGEEKPDRPYRKIALVETYGKTPANRINFLKDKARGYGADAIIVFTSTSHSVLENDESTFEAVVEVASGEEIPDHWWSRNEAFMQAYAIVYEENLAPELFNQFGEVRVYNEDDSTLNDVRIKAVEFNYQGEMVKDFTNDNSEEYPVVSLYPERSDIDFLANGKENWVETRSYSGGRIRVTERKQLNASGKWIRYVKLDWNGDGQITRINLQERLLYEKQPVTKYDIYPLYDETGRMIGQHWYRLTRDKKIPYAIEKYNYDDDRLTSKIIEKYEDTERTPWIKIDYQPFPEDYHLKEEQGQ
ncbi:MAG: hypothetical protein WBB45_09735 [Cyclobacteriaceae bacterium]